MKFIVDGVGEHMYANWFVNGDFKVQDEAWWGNFYWDPTQTWTFDSSAEVVAELRDADNVARSTYTWIITVVEAGVHEDRIPFSKWPDMEHNVTAYRGDRVKFIVDGVTEHMYANWSVDGDIKEQDESRLTNGYWDPTFEWSFPNSLDTVEVKADIRDGENTHKCIYTWIVLVKHPVAVAELNSALPRGYVLSQNRPNPFNGTTTIPYQLPEAASVALEVWNSLGQRVRLLVDDYQPAGYYTAVWDGKDQSGQDVSSGVYLCRLQAGNFVATTRIVLVR